MPAQNASDFRAWSIRKADVIFLASAIGLQCRLNPWRETSARHLQLIAIRRSPRVLLQNTNRDLVQRSRGPPNRSGGIPAPGAASRVAQPRERPRTRRRRAGQPPSGLTRRVQPRGPETEAETRIASGFRRRSERAPRSDQFLRAADARLERPLPLGARSRHPSTFKSQRPVRRACPSCA